MQPQGTPPPSQRRRHPPLPSPHRAPDYRAGPPDYRAGPSDYRANLQCRPQKYEVGPLDETEQLEADETTYQHGNKRDARLEQRIATNPPINEK